jgi:hypothetical protein
VVRSPELGSPNRAPGLGFTVGTRGRGLQE